MLGSNSTSTERTRKEETAFSAGTMQVKRGQRPIQQAARKHHATGANGEMTAEAQVRRNSFRK